MAVKQLLIILCDDQDQSVAFRVLRDHIGRLWRETFPDGLKRRFTPVFLGLERLRQEECCMLEASLGYKGNARLHWAAEQESVSKEAK